MEKNKRRDNGTHSNEPFDDDVKSCRAVIKDGQMYDGSD